jgi:hypothetical protein
MDPEPDVSVPDERRIVEIFCITKEGTIIEPVEIVFADIDLVVSDVPVIGPNTVRLFVLRTCRIPVILSMVFVDIKLAFNVEIFTTFSTVCVVDIVVAETKLTVIVFAIILNVDILFVDKVWIYAEAALNVFVEIVPVVKVLNVIEDVSMLPVEIVFADKDANVVGPPINDPTEIIFVETV